MGDQDVVERAAALVGAKANFWNPPSHRKHGWKPQYVMYLTGHRLTPTLKAIRPYLGERRGAKADELLEWSATVHRPTRGGS